MPIDTVTSIVLTDITIPIDKAATHIPAPAYRDGVPRIPIDPSPGFRPMARRPFAKQSA